MWTNYHCHTHYCDGKHSVSEIVEEARRQNMRAIGISSHAPIRPKLPWCMDLTQLHNYLKEIHNQRLQYSDIEIYAGLEVDYIPGVISPADFRPLLDYTIGSVHMIGGGPGTGFEIDGPTEKFTEGLQRIYGGNFQEAAIGYFTATREMITASRPDVIGHMDKIKIQDRDGQYFTEQDVWWIEQLELTLNEIATQDCIIEVNTRGIYQKKSHSTYPSPWILELAHRKGIRVTISSDAHLKGDLTREFDNAARILMEAGYREIHILSEGKWIPRHFNEQGLVD
jgi:histidinol-phosphatase (PHP family)